MVEPMAVSIAGTVASKLLEQVMAATKIAISCNKCCKVLHALLQELQPIVDYAVPQISQSNFDNAFKRPRSAVHEWLDELEGTLKRAAVEVNKCIEQQRGLNPVSRYNTGKRILDVTESVKKLLQQAGLVGLAVALSESSRAQKMEKMMQEQHEMMESSQLRATALRIEFATFTQESLQENYTTSSAQGVTSAIKSALYNLLQSLPLRPSDNNYELDQLQLNYELDQVQLNDELDQVQLNDELDQVQLNDELDQVQLNDELDQVQLNEELCRYLDNVLVDIRITLDDPGKDLSTSKRDDRERALKELDLVVKRAESLIRKCMCKDSSWLDAAITLANIKEEILEIQLELSWWANMVEIASVQDLDSGESVVQNAVKAMRKQSALLESLVKEGSSLQRAAEVDKENLVSKLLRVKEEHAKEEDHEYVLSVYLLSQMTEDIHIVEMVRSKLKVVKWGKPLGKGTYGLVNKVKWFQRKCAVKTVKSYEKEVKTLSRCNHPHIVQFFWHWEEQSQAYIIMERMSQNLEDHIEVQAEKRGGQPFELHVAIDIMLQVAKAMHYLHKKKIVHRDLKTSNILVDDSTEGYVVVKLADFGLAKTYDRTQTVSTQTIGGTTRYAAPEVNLVDGAMIHGTNTQKFLGKADVWSFAMVCSEILTGNIPFTGMDVNQSEIHDKIAEPNFRPFLPNDSCFDYLRFCITSCWSHDQEKRPDFSTICQMLKLAKMLSLGVTSFDTCKSLFSRNPPIWMDPKNEDLEIRCISASMIGRDYLEYRSPLKYCSPLLGEPWLDVVTTRPLSQGGVHDAGQAYWIDDPTGGVSYSIAARGLNVWWNTEEYLKWIPPCPGARSSEVAHLQKVCWFEMGGLIDWPLLPGAYTLSWRLQLTPEAYLVEDHGWLKHPVVFELGLNKSAPFKQTMRYLANEDVERQEQLGTNLTPIRLVGDNWFEYDVGEINIMDSGENANFSFSMKAINPDKGFWKHELLVDGVVLRPTSLAKTIGQSLSIGELAERHNNFVKQGFRYL